MTDLVIQILTAHPWLIYSFIGASLLAAGIRAAYPVSEERPRWIVFALAIIDAAQLNISGPVKLIAKPKG